MIIQDIEKINDDTGAGSRVKEIYDYLISNNYKSDYGLKLVYYNSDRIHTNILLEMKK